MSCPLQPRLPLLPLWQKPAGAIMQALLRIHAPRRSRFFDDFLYGEGVIPEQRPFS